MAAVGGKSGAATNTLTSRASALLQSIRGVPDTFTISPASSLSHHSLRAMKALYAL